MALPSSGPITLQMIADEFGGTPPLKLKDYYGVAPGIPTSGPIKLKDFYGTSAGGSLPNVVRGSFVTAVPDIRDHLDSQAGGDAHLDFASIAQDGDLVVMAVTADGPAGVFCQLNNAADHQVWGDLSMEMEPPTLQPLYYVAVTQWESQKKNPYFINVSGNGAGVSVVGVVFAAEWLDTPVADLRAMTSWNMSGPMVVRDSIATSPLDSNDLGTNPLELVVQVLHRDDEDFISSVSAPDYTLVDISNSTDPGRTAQSSTAVLFKHILPPASQEVPVTDIAFDGVGDFSTVTTTIAFQTTSVVVPNISNISS